MEIQNLNGETKLIIEDIIEIGKINDDLESTVIKLKEQMDIQMNDICIYNVCIIIYDKKDDTLFFYSVNNNIGFKKIEFSEIIIFDNLLDNNLLNIRIEKIPLFISVGETEFPNFEIHTSGNMYSIDIYINEYTHMTINWYQSHDNLKDTLQYLSDLTEFLSSEPELLPNIFKHSTMEIVIGSSIEYEQRGIHDYELCDDGIKIIVPDGEPIVVDWHKFFKLVMDGTWEIKFIDSENKEI